MFRTQYHCLDYLFQNVNITFIVRFSFLSWFNAWIGLSKVLKKGSTFLQTLWWYLVLSCLASFSDLVNNWKGFLTKFPHGVLVLFSSTNEPLTLWVPILRKTFAHFQNCCLHHWKPFKNDQEFFLFELKSSFRSRDI